MRAETTPPPPFTITAAHRPAAAAANLGAMLVMGGTLLVGIALFHAMVARDVRVRAMQDERLALNERVTRFTMALARDSMLRKLRAVPATPRVQVLTTPASAATVQQGRLAVVERADSSASGRVVLLMEANGLLDVPGLPRTRLTGFSVVPSATDGTTCLMWTPVYAGNGTTAGVSKGTRLDNYPGACAFVAQYGLPSRERIAWLDARGWRPAAYAERAWDPPEPDSVRAWSAKRAVNSFARQFEGTFTQARAFTGLVARCLDGDDALCGHLYFDHEGYMAAGSASNPWLNQPVGVVARTGLQGDVLARVAKRFGPDRFRRWWTSPDTSSAGFAAVFGESDAQFARAGLAQMAEPRLPVPTLRLRDVVPGLLLLLVLLGWLAVPARREATA